MRLAQSVDQQLVAGVGDTIAEFDLRESLPKLIIEMKSNDPDSNEALIDKLDQIDKKYLGKRNE